MTSSREILRFLTDLGLVSTPEDLRISHDRLTVNCVSAEDEATEGALSWLSPARFKRSPQRIRQFRGAILLAPALVGVQETASGVAIGCPNPKVAFALVVQEFFPHLLRSPWPTDGNTRHAGASVADDAVIACGVVLGDGVKIGPHAEIGPYTCIAHTTVGAGTKIGAHCAIGLPGFGFEQSNAGEWIRFPHIGRVEIGEQVEIGSNTCIDRGALGATRIEAGAKIDNLVHIAHNVVIGERSLVIAHAMIAGSVKLGSDAWVAPSSAILNQLTVGAGAVIGLGAVVIRDVAPGATVVGNPAKPLMPREPDGE